MCRKFCSKRSTFDKFILKTKNINGPKIADPRTAAVSFYFKRSVFVVQCMHERCSECVLELLRRTAVCLGANVNKTTHTNDHTVLSLACSNGHLDVVRLLLRSGADVSHKLKVFNLYYFYCCCGIKLS